MKLYQIPPEMSGKRFDQALVELMPEVSRSRLQLRINSGEILLDAKQQRPKYKVQGGESVSVKETTLEAGTDLLPQPMELDLVYEDEHILIINKPVGLVVHPGAGNHTGTLLNGLIYRWPGLAQLPRAGIVHRLDKGTSGLMMVALSETAHKSLVDQLAARTVKREYLALVRGRLISGGTIDQPIGRHPQDRKKMAISPGGRNATTHYRIAEKLTNHTLLNIRLETGRTHQIRVHMAHIRHPVVGDQAYGNHATLVANCSERTRQTLLGFNHQALHANRLTLEHPGNGETLQWESRPPDDFQQLLEILREEAV